MERSLVDQHYVTQQELNYQHMMPIDFLETDQDGFPMEQTVEQVQKQVEYLHLLMLV